MLAALAPGGRLPADAAAEQELRWVMQVVAGIRQIRGEMDIARLAPPAAAAAAGRARTICSWSQRHRPLIAHLARLASVRALRRRSRRAPPAAAALVGELALLVPMAG